MYSIPLRSHFGSSFSASKCLIAAPCTASSAMALPMKAMKAVAMKKGAMKKASAMKAMKTGMKAMKKGMKTAMKKSVIAKGKGAKTRVFRGKKEKTASGLTKEKLHRNKRGKVVSKAASAHGKKLWVKNGLKAWSDAVKKARKELGVKGFVAIGGKTAAGKALYAKAKSLL